MNSLAQFFTPDGVTRHVVAGLSASAPQKLVDLGVGIGCLLAAAHNRWPHAHLVGVDIDPTRVYSTHCRLPTANCFHADALCYDLLNLLGIEAGSIDLAVGNPPYGRFQAGIDHKWILDEANLADAVPLQRITREVVFLAQNLRLLRAGGELAVILPEGIGTSQVYADLRRALMERHGLWRVLELPPRLFRGTEAKTLAIFLRKGEQSGTVRLERWNDGGQIVVSPGDAVHRLDASFHLASYGIGKIILADLAPEIKRGAVTREAAAKLGATMFHTTDFKRYADGRARFPSDIDLPSRWLAKAGDLLIPRVGSRCLAHVVMVEAGQAVFTDCVYRIRVATECCEALFRYLRSPEGVAQRLIRAHGVCARVLSKEELLKLPLPFTSL